jgi:beta-lactam-binding protein with PASTA domain
MVPDFRGLSMAQARERLPEAISRVRFAGRGIVTDQFPAPGTPLADATEIVLHFATPAEVPTR